MSSPALTALANVLKTSTTTSQIQKGVSEVFEKQKYDSQVAGIEFNEKEYLDKAIKFTVNSFRSHLKYQIATKNAIKPIEFENVSRKENKILSNWTFKQGFLATRFRAVAESAVDGNRFFGHYTENGIVYPFDAKITYIKRNPVTNKIICLKYIIDTTKINEVNLFLIEEWEWEDELGLYEVTRYYAEANSEKMVKSKQKLDKSLQREEFLFEIDGVVMEANYESMPDDQHTKFMAEDAGYYLAQMRIKFPSLSPKVLSKQTIVGASFESDFKNKTFVNLQGRAAQYQQPISVFNPTLPNSDIMATVNWLFNRYLELSNATQSQGAAKKAQTNDMEVATTDKHANNYAEYRKNILEWELTTYMNQVAIKLGLDLSEDFKVIVPQSTQQEVITNVNSQQQGGQ